MAGGKGKVELSGSDAAGWDALRKEAGFNETAPAESMTIDEYAEKFGLTRWVADDELNKLVAAGKLKVGRRYGKSHGRRFLLKAYWPA